MNKINWVNLQLQAKLKVPSIKYYKWLMPAPSLMACAMDLFWARKANRMSTPALGNVANIPCVDWTCRKPVGMKIVYCTLLYVGMCMHYDI